MVSLNICCNDQQVTEGKIMSVKDKLKVNIILGDTILTATLDDNPTTRDLISLLPLSIELEDYASTEKITYLQRKLSIENALTGFNPDIGDITYYAPWGNIAIFYKDFGYASGLIKLGKIDDSVELLSATNSINVRIELVQ